MLLFHDYFEKTFAEVCSTHDLAIFSVVVYLRTWLTAPIAMDAPLNYYTLSWGNSWFTHKVPHTTIFASTRDVNKDLTPKDQDKDKDLTPRTRTRTRTSWT